MNFSKRGDMGETSLLGGQRVPKFDPRPETYGVLDEASSMLGVARAMTKSTRIKAILLRGRGRAESPPRHEFEDFVLDRDARILKKKDKEIPLTRTEFDLLAYFCANEGKALSRETVMNDVWGTEYYGTQRSLDSFVASLRSKIEKKAGKPEHILTVHGVGYKFVK